MGRPVKNKLLESEWAQELVLFFSCNILVQDYESKGPVLQLCGCHYADDLTYVVLETAFVFMLLLPCTMMSRGSVGWREEGIGGDLYFTLKIFLFFVMPLSSTFQKSAGVTAHMLRTVAIATSLAAHTALLEGLGAACGICSQEDTHPL